MTKKRTPRKLICPCGCEYATPAQVYANDYHEHEECEALHVGKDCPKQPGLPMDIPKERQFD